MLVPKNNINVIFCSDSFTQRLLFERNNFLPEVSEIAIVVFGKNVECIPKFYQTAHK
jgi:hypothetical protein